MALKIVTNKWGKNKKTELVLCLKSKKKINRMLKGLIGNLFLPFFSIGKNFKFFKSFNIMNQIKQILRGLQ